jgi:hypothetical protein
MYVIHNKRFAFKLVVVVALLFICDVMHAQPNTLSPSSISYIPNTSLSVRDVHTDCIGDIVYVGGTASSAFAISPNTISTTYNGGNSDVFIVKVDSSGKPKWSTLLGGTLYDRAYAVEIDTDGFIYIAGRAGTGLPTTECALQKTFAGDNNPNSAYGIQDGFITKITPDGSRIVWSTYIGCDGRGFVRDIDIDSKGNIWAGISNASPNFPYITKNALQSTTTASMSPALIKLSSDGRTILYGTFLSDGMPTSSGPTTVRIDNHDNVYFLSHASANKIPVTANVFQPKVAGKNDFVLSKFDTNGNLLFCSFLGGAGDEEVETHSLEIDTAGNPIVAAYTYGTGYPIVGNAVQTSFKGVRDGVITKISSDGSTILASTYLGGNQVDEIQGIGIDAHNNIYVTGRTGSADFPVTTPTAFQSSLRGTTDGHITVVSSDLSTILYSTYVGGTGTEDLRCCHVDEWGRIHTGGVTASTNLPVIKEFSSSLTGTTTGTAVVFSPAVLFQPNNTCTITDTFGNPCMNTSIHEITTNEDTLIPNQSIVTDVLTISLDKEQNNKQRIQIYNAFCVLVKEFEINQTTQIDVSDLSSGLYFIQYVCNTHSPRKFIKL